MRYALQNAIAQGVDILDIGACSTRPDAQRYPSVEEEWDRLAPILELLADEFAAFRHEGGLVSIDTFRPEIVSRAATYGFDIVNDVSGGTETMDEWLAAHAEYTYVQCFTTRAYNIKKVQSVSDIQPVPKKHLSIAEVIDYLAHRVDYLRQMGIAHIWIDPAFGFGMTAEQSLDLLANLRYLKVLDCPIIAGISHKRMARVSGTDKTEELEQWAIEQGANIIRQHEINNYVRA